MSSRRQWRDFLALNPEYARQAVQQGSGQFQPKPLVRELGAEAAWALIDENHGTQAERAAQIAKRATLAQQRGQAREAPPTSRPAAPGDRQLRHPAPPNGWRAARRRPRARAARCRPVGDGDSRRRGTLLRPVGLAPPDGLA